MKTRYRVHAEFLRTVANPKRLEILHLLRDGRRCVTQLAAAMEVSLAAASQELAPLRTAGILRTHREGKTVYYALANPKVLHACDLLAESMRELQAARASAIEEPASRLEPFLARSSRRAL